MSAPGLVLKGILISALLAGTFAPAAAVTRDEVMVRARGFAFHPWRCGTGNVRASCSSPYRSVYVPGDYMGLPYDWGGHMNVFQFDQKLLLGEGAGSYPADGVLSCTAGLDCSGFVSQTWGSGHHTTRSLDTISTRLTSVAQLLAGDVMNEAGYHVALFSHRLGNGDPVWIEAIGYNTHVNATGGWSYVDTFVPLRYRSITGTTAGNPVGSQTNPIVIGSLPYQDSRDTRQSPVDFFDGCNAAPATNESGPEYVYELRIDRPGQLTVSLTDDAGVDIDVHLFAGLSTNDCVARNDARFTTPVGCGTYYVVADTYSGAAKAGRYTLNVSLAPDASAACGTGGPRPYAYFGEPGDACAYPGNQSLPFCNENLGSETCIYTSSNSFCSYACTRDADCGAIAGGCCGEVGSGEQYCMTSAFCGPVEPPDPPDPVIAPDAGRQDAVLDAGTIDPPPDAGTIEPPPDAGTNEVPDAGTVDARPDAGTTPADAGHEPDPAEETDAGRTPDRSIPDAGDADPPVKQGCGCSSGSTAGAAFALLLALPRRRRSRG